MPGVIFVCKLFLKLNPRRTTIGQIHRSTLINFENATKLLTDGRTEAERQNLELRAEIKTVQARLEKSEKVNIWKNSIIIVLVLGIFVLIGIVLKISMVF